MIRLRPRRIFYGWWVVATGTAVMFVHSAVYFFGFGAFFTPLVDEFGWSRAALSGAFSLSRLEGGLLSPIAGLIVDRHGARPLLLVSFFMMGLGFILLSRVDSLLSFYLVYTICLGLGAGFGMGAVVSSSVNNWFSRRRSMALGIAHAGVGIGGLGAGFLAWMIDQIGWRQSAMLVGVAVIAFGIPLAAVMRHKPEKYGLLRDGDPQPEHSAGAAAPEHVADAARSASQSAEPDYTARQALFSRTFWLLTTSFNLRQFVTSAMAAHLIPYLVTIGYSLTMAASLFSLMAVTSTVGRLGAGWLGDRIDRRRAMAICLAFLALGVVFSLVSSSLWVIVGAMLLYGLAYGGTTPLSPSLVGEYFGRRSFGTILGFMSSAQILGSLGGPLAAGYLFDLTGSYDSAFGLFVVACCASIVMILVLRPSAHAPLLRAPG